MYINIQNFLLNENVQQAKNILKNLNLDPNKESDFKDISKSLEKLPNLISKFVDFRYNQKAEKEDLKRAIDWIINNRDLIGKLPKNILNYDNLEKLNDDIEDLKRSQKINKFYKSLYASMRKQVDELNEEKRKEFDDLSFAFMKLTEERQKQFTPLKYFEYNNISIDEFIKALHNFLEKNIVNEDEKNILEKIEKYGDRIKIRYNMNNLLVIQTEDNEAVCDLGSQSWCIVYGSDSTRKSYFGPDTYNTQLIVFNFNLPSTSSNSMFGITVKPTGEISYGASQNKVNHNISLEEIKKSTDLPDSVFKPDELKVAQYSISKNIQKIISDAKNKSTNEINIIEVINSFNKLFEEENIVNKFTDKDKDDIIYESIKKIISNTSLILYYIKNTFDNKSPEEIIDILSKYKPLNKLFKDSNINPVDFIIGFLNCDNKESGQFLFIYYLNSSENNITKIKNKYDDNGFDFNKINISTPYILDFNKSLQNIEINDNDFNKYFSLIKSDNKEEIKDIVIKIYKNVKDGLHMFIMEYPNKSQITFDNYINIYDNYYLKEDKFPYEHFINHGLYIVCTESYIKNETFINFIIKLINDLKDSDNEDVDTDGVKKIIDDICESVKYDYTYDILDKHSDEISYMYEKTNLLPDEKNHILGLMMYKNTSLYNNKFRKQIGIKTTEDGIDYIVVSDFTSFDDLIFKEEYFNQLEDYSGFDYNNHNDYDLNNYFNDIDNFNLISISKLIIDEFEDIPFIKNKNIINKYIQDDKIDILLKNKYEKDDDLKSLFKELNTLLFNTDDDELDEYNEDLKYFLDDDIKKDILNRALNQAYETAYNDELWKKLIDEVENALGGGYWPQTEDDLRIDREKSIYKFVTNPDKNTTDLLFTIDIAYIVDDITSYSDLYYNYDSDFNWENLIKYRYSVMTDKISVYLDNIYADVSKKHFNESIRDL